MRIIVTGGSGFIGSQLVWELAKRHSGTQLVVVDDFSSGNFRNLAGFGGDVVARPCEQLDWNTAFASGTTEQIYHLASITDTTVRDQRLMLERNIEGFRRVLDYARQRAVPVVYASSGATYGQRNGTMSEDMTPDPANVYGFSKAILDNLARDAASEGLKVSGVRYFNVYGPGEQHKGKMASMIYQLYLQMKQGQRPRIFRDGQHERDFVYVKDAVEGTILAAQSGQSGVYNMGSGRSDSFNRVVELLNQSLGTQLEPEYIDNPYEDFYQHHTQADLSRSRTALGYQPKWDLASGVEDYINWLQGAGQSASAGS